MISYSSRPRSTDRQDEVYDALLDAGLYPQWTDMVDASFDDPAAPSVGTRGRFRLAKGPIKGTCRWR